jgi:molecular chaperone DnaK
MERARETLTKASHKLAEQMYKSAQAQTPPPGGDAGPSGSAGGAQPGGGDSQTKKDEGVIDAEYVDVDKK